MGGFSQTASIQAPASHATPITPSLVTELSIRAIYVGGDGDLEVVMLGGEIVTFRGLLAGILLPIMVKKVTTGTTATNLIGLW
jgi:hypothetical protein